MTHEELVAGVEAAVRERGGDTVRRESNFRCPDPAHHTNGDADPSASWNSEKKTWWCPVGNVGGGYKDLAKRLGIDVVGNRRDRVHPPSLDAFARQRHLPLSVLREFRVGATVHGHRPALRYPTTLGVDRIKYLDGERPKYKWARRGEGGRAHWYGLDKALLLLRAGARRLYVVNGEPSVWACATRGVPAVCLCGECAAPSAELVAELKAKLAEAGVVEPEIRIVYDTDRTGRAGGPKVAKVLLACGLTDVAVLDLASALPDVEKGDVDDLQRRVGEELQAVLAHLPVVDAEDTAPTDELPVIVVTGRPLRDITAEAVDALEAANDPPELFVRFGAPARVRLDERGRPLTERAAEAIVRHRLARVAEFVKLQAKAPLPTPPPSEVVQDILALKRWPFPPLEAVTEVPVLRPDGTAVTVPGYDPGTRLVYEPAPGLVIPPIPECPSLKELHVARNTLIDIIAEFPFVDNASAANTLALLLTPVLRPVIAGQVPLALIDKPKRGTGATLVAQLVTILTLGSDTDLMTAPHDDEEWRKKITAALLAGATIMFFDNVEHALSSPSLAAALTSPFWSDRILGHSEMAKDLPQRATWMATGNNLKVGGDLARRCYWVRVDAGVARPWQRDRFRHADLKAYARQNRGRLLAAVLTLARGWFAARCPKPDMPKVGGFEAWATTVGGVLQHAGVSGFLGNLDALYDQVDEDEIAWEAFLAAWASEYGDRALTVSEVVADVKGEQHPLRAVLPPDLAEALVLDGKGKASFERRFGKALAKRGDGVFGTWRLERAGKDEHANVARWRVVKAEPRGFSGFPGFVPPDGPGDEQRSDSASASGGSDARESAEGNPQNPPNPQPEEPGHEAETPAAPRRKVSL